MDNHRPTIPIPRFNRATLFLLALIFVTSILSVAGNLLIDRKVLDVAAHFAMFEKAVQEAEHSRAEILAGQVKSTELHNRIIGILEEIRRDRRKPQTKVPPEAEGGS